MCTADRVYIKEIYRLVRTVDKLTCGQARIDPDSDEVRVFYLFITPDDGYYKGATCKFKVYVPETYPEEAPEVVCLNSIYHPNIDINFSEAAVCVNLLGEDWQPGVGLDGCIMAVLYLFHHPNLEDALSPVFDGSLMDEEVFLENVRASLRGETVEEMKFDCLIQEQDFVINEQMSKEEIKEDYMRNNENEIKHVNKQENMGNVDIFDDLKENKQENIRNVNDAFTRQNKEIDGKIDESSVHLIDGGLMTEDVFMENKEENIRNDVFTMQKKESDNKVNETDILLKGDITSYETSNVKDCVHKTMRPQNQNKIKDDQFENSFTNNQHNITLNTAVICKNIRRFIFQILQWPKFAVASFFLQVWHTMLKFSKIFLVKKCHHLE